MSAYYRRNLPHYQPDDVVLFITFRLAGSLPPKIISNLKSERKHELHKFPASKKYYIEKKYFDRYDG